MMPFVVKPILRIRGKLSLLGDKSIAHRAVILSALSKTKTRIKNFPANIDCLTTIEVFRKLGVKIKISRIRSSRTTVTVHGRGLYGFSKPKTSLQMGESGTSMRLVLGVLAGQDFSVKLQVGKSLSKRPMRRVTEPLRIMGAKINSKAVRKHKGINEEYPPIIIKGGRLHSISYSLPIASAQVKSAILLAGLFASGETCIIERFPTRDHTERMLRAFGAGIQVLNNKIVIKGERDLVSPKEIFIPGDISSASFFIALALIKKNSRILIKNISLNPSRQGFIRVLERMGGCIKIVKTREISCTAGEPIGNLIVKSSCLRATKVRREEVPFLIDELPILMVLACFAEGKTVLEGVEELRVKETDRIKSMACNLRNMGADVVVSRQGNSENIIIRGTGRLEAYNARCFGDHRTAMSLIIAGLCATGNTVLDDVSCIAKSFPNFLTIIKSLNK